jgi:hypothetical protein
MPETWYVLEDGTAADPGEVMPDKTGRLRHKGGAAVAMRGDVPSTRSVDPEEQRAKAKKFLPKNDRQLKADDDGVKYKTR